MQPKETFQRSLFLLALSLFAFAIPSARAVVVVEEPFTYADATTITNYGGGTGWSGNWGAPVGNATNNSAIGHFEIVSNQAIYKGSSAGQAVMTQERSLAAPVGVTTTDTLTINCDVIIGPADGQIGRGIGLNFLSGGEIQFTIGKRLNGAIAIWDNGIGGASVQLGSDALVPYINNVSFRITHSISVALTYDGTDTFLFATNSSNANEVTHTFEGKQISFDAIQLTGYHQSTTGNGIDSIVVDFSPIPLTAPEITAQPQDATVVLGSTNAVSFSVTATGFPLPTYQWKADGANLPGATDATLVISPVNPSDIADYSVGITNSQGGVVSTNAALAYVTTAVTPVGQSVFAGLPAEFSISMPEYQTYTYQWKQDGGNISGATNASLTIPAAGLADAGAYSVDVTWSGVTVESDPATLVVLTAPTQPYSQLVSNQTPVAWWRLNETAGSFTATDIIGGKSASSLWGDFYGDITWAQEGALLGESDAAAEFTGFGSNGRSGRPMLDVAYDASLNPAVFTVECWVLLQGDNGAFRSPLTSRDNANLSGYMFYVAGDGTWQFWLGDGTQWTAIAGVDAVLNEWAHLVGAYDGSTMRFYVNGALVGSAATGYAPNGTFPLRIGAGASENLSGSFFFPGRIDEVVVYNSALSASQVAAHYAAAFPSGATPRFTLQPYTRTTMEESDYRLEVKAHSTPPVSYQWQHDGTNLPGATSATLVLGSVTAADAGSYRAVATHGVASATSSAGDLSLLSGSVVSVNLRGFGADSLAGNGGQAGQVWITNWNEIGYNTPNGSATDFVTQKGVSVPMSVTWSSPRTRGWNGPVSDPIGDLVLLNGFLEADSNAVTVAVSGIPAAYQNVGYSLYVYMGAPSFAKGEVTTADSFGALSVEGMTNYFHGIDLAIWDGSYVLASTTDPNQFTPADANYALFTGLTNETFTITAIQHPLQPGPVGISGFQIVADTPTLASNPTNLIWSVSGDQLDLSWPQSHLGWTLQTQTSGLGVGLTTNWVDVPGSEAVTATNFTVNPADPTVFFRLRN